MLFRSTATAAPQTSFNQLGLTPRFSLARADPGIYIARFAKHLDFKDDFDAVVNTAGRIVKQMKKDWIHYGRRPSGICGAALVFAGRIYGFHLGVDDVVKVAKIGAGTLRKRLVVAAKLGGQRFV